MSADELLSDEETLFASPGILDVEYLPTLMPYREGEQKYLADCIKRLPSIGTNVLIHGPPGIGKTASVKWVFRELKESGESEVVPIYINCWKDTDMHRMVLSLCSQFEIDRTYKSPDELLSMVMKRLKAFKAVVLTFDEIDRAHDQMFLYNFLEELPHKSIFMISTKKDWIAHLDTRIRSRLMPEIREFKPYNREQTRDILEERQKHAFVPGVWEKDAFEMVVGKCFGSGDLRTGLVLLKASGLVAEQEANREVRKEHVSKAMEKLELKPAPEGKEKKISDFG